MTNPTNHEFDRCPFCRELVRDGRHSMTGLFTCAVPPNPLDPPLVPMPWNTGATHAPAAPHPATDVWRSVRDSMKHYGHEWNDARGNRLVLTDERYADCDEWCLGLYSPYDDNDPLMDEDVNNTPAYYVYGTQEEITTALEAFGLEFPVNSFRIIAFPE